MGAPFRKLFLAVLLAGLAFSANAQFVVDGSERSFLKWNQIRTEDYRFVFPAGMDSLARVYAGEWERWKLPVSHSIGFVPNEGYRRRMPVILHPYLGYSNGMVVWTPRRMEMYTGPDMSSPNPIAWQTVLAIHEQRHVSQMQFLRRKPLTIWSYLTGETLAGFFSIYYLDPSHFEGDAVAAETGLTESGRARTADFLEYYRASFDEGEMRNYERWRYGSQRLYTPDYYKVGYLAIGGMRTVYDKPLFMKDYYDRLIPYRRLVRRQTKMKFKDAFGGIMAVQDSLWRADDKARAPFQPLDRLTEPDRYYISFSGLAYDRGRIYALRSGIADNLEIVSIDTSDGKVRPLHLSGADSPLSAGAGRLFWSEVTYDPRWEMHSHSSVRYLENGSTHTLVHKGRWYNPKAFGDTLAVCRNDCDGASYVVLLSASDGAVLEEFRAPDGVAPFETVIKGEEIFCAAITDSGEGIYHVPSFTPFLEPSFVKINHLFVRDDKIFFTSDRTGVNELYSAGPDGVLQHTNLKAGGQDFVFGADGQLYFTYLQPSGRMVCRTPVDSLPVRAVDFSVRHRYELEERLSAQEAALAAAAPADTAAPCIGAPRRYSKLAHAIKIHSWIPFYADYDELSAMSFENLTTSLGLGATAYFQNDLNTLYGSVGYSAIPGFLTGYGRWLNSGVVNLTYRGLYPVFEGKLAANRFGVSSITRVYVPFNLSSDGLSRAVVPGVQVSTSPFATTALIGIRAYSVLPKLKSCYFPLWGIGYSAGIAKDFDFGPMLPYFSVYGYVPGLWKTSGLGLSLSYSTEPFVNESITKAHGISLATTELRANYAIPFLSVDWNGLSPLMYVRNFEFIPKVSETIYRLRWDPTRVTPSGGPTSYRVCTAGAALDVVLGNFWFVPYDIRVGVSAAYVHGNPDPEAKPYEINLVLNIDL